MSKTYKLWYMVKEPWGFYKAMVGVYTDKSSMLSNVKTCIQNLVNQIDTTEHKYEVVHGKDKSVLLVTKMYDLSNVDKSNCFHCFLWEEFELNTIDVEDIKLSSYAY